MAKHKPKGAVKNRPTFWNILSVISLLITISWIIFQLTVQLPINRELARIKHDFPMVRDIYEIIGISKEIPLPEPLETTKHLDYFPTVLLKTSEQASGYFESATYGYVLKLDTGLNTYLATDSDQNANDKRIVFSVGELIENRKKLTWILYEGPFPPEGWTRFN